MAQASPGPPAPAVNTALCDADTDDGKMTAADKSRLEAATAAEQQGGRQTEKNASTPSKRGRFTLELVEERRHHYQHTEQQLYVTHANCDLALSPAPSSSLAVITPQQRKFVKKVGRFVVEEDVDVETTTNSESGSGSTARAPSRRRIGRFEVAPHEGSGSVTPSLMVYPVLESRKRRTGHTQKVDKKQQQQQANVSNKSRRSEEALLRSKRPRGDSMPQCIPFSNAASPDVRRVGRFEIEECSRVACTRGSSHHNSSDGDDDTVSFGDIPVVLYTTKVEDRDEKDDEGVEKSQDDLTTGQ
ncbi:hypothetical protein FOZ60_012531 [Perkinsus olseni]|uniref:Uncharacterized protein n=1 Tax=Perkinsus olseni TaxID=32597 RepID=A0A7J6PAC2_PEROL|nr:hypothetical protein FOZ60_012531 [Perkinsus olseni]